MKTVSLPKPESLWEHHSGRRYRVEMVANVDTQYPDQFPITVVYRGEANGKVWARPLAQFLEKMTPIQE